eukprot:177356-Hanusia_phi.AAC.1
MVEMEGCNRVCYRGASPSPGPPRSRTGASPSPASTAACRSWPRPRYRPLYCLPSNLKTGIRNAST